MTNYHLLLIRVLQFLIFLFVRKFQFQFVHLLQVFKNKYIKKTSNCTDNEPTYIDINQNFANPQNLQ